CLDLRRPEGHAVIGDRAFADDPALVARLGRAQAEALLAGGVLPVIKHLPGHGRAGLDSHHALPVVDAGLDELAATDFAPFHALRDLPIGMTAHIVYSALDAAPATQSAAVVAQVIRGRIGFDGLLLTDDLNMQALSGDLADRARHSLAAGCDVVLHCSGVLGEMQQVAPVVEPLEGAALTRWQRAALLLKEPEAIDAGALQARLTALLPAGPAAI
ncbi:MAG TPA: glycoside hydrolase family 3 N-terminal domain-containing protein, partial [Alphaproteobacteria bacterium]|nr:glycoside hydrolase family 3 N-terminal domain-containing protein [Alphaproteobacteria bacterium]